jgi:spore maturation protein CgeB
MFEAMACGIPIVSAPWDDVEGIFPAGTYLRAGSREEMIEALKTLLRDRDFAAEIADTAFRLVNEHHTCRHRADELIRITDGIHNSRHSPIRPLCEEPIS